MPDARLGFCLVGLRRLVVVLLVAAGSMVAAESASATKADFFERRISKPPSIALQIQGDPNEANDIVVAFDAARGGTRRGRRVGGSINLFPVFFLTLRITPFNCSNPFWQRPHQCDGAAITFISVALGDGDDTLTLDPSVSIPTLLHGGPGRDTIFGGSGRRRDQRFAGEDTLSGGAGNDILYSHGEVGSIPTSEGGFLAGGPGDDVFWGTDGKETFDGGEGNDEVRAFGGDDTINGGDGDDLLNGGDGGDTMEGGAGNDGWGP